MRAIPTKAHYRRCLSGALAFALSLMPLVSAMAQTPDSPYATRLAFIHTADRYLQATTRDAAQRRDLRDVLFTALIAAQIGTRYPDGDALDRLRFVLKHTLARGQTWAAEDLVAAGPDIRRVLRVELALYAASRGEVDRAIDLAGDSRRALEQASLGAAHSVDLDTALGIEARIDWMADTRSHQDHEDGRRLIAVARRVEHLAKLAHLSDEPDEKRRIATLAADTARGWVGVIGFSEKSLAQAVASLGELGLLDVVHEWAEKFDADSPFSRMIHHVAGYSFAKHGLINDAIDLLRNDAEALNDLHEQLRRAGRDKDAKTVFDAMQHPSPFSFALEGRCERLSTDTFQDSRNSDEQRERVVELAALNGLDKATECWAQLQGLDDNGAAAHRNALLGERHLRWTLLRIGLNLAADKRPVEAEAVVRGVLAQGEVRRAEENEIALIRAISDFGRGHHLQALSHLRSVTSENRLFDMYNVLEKARHMQVVVYRTAIATGNASLEMTALSDLLADNDLWQEDDWKVHSSPFRPAAPEWCGIPRNLYLATERALLVDRVLRVVSAGGGDAGRTERATWPELPESDEIGLKLCVHLAAGEMNEAISMLRNLAAMNSGSNDWRRYAAVLASRL